MKDENNITYRHRMPAQLRFSDVDTFGHVNNSVYFSLFDMGKTQYFIDVVGEHVFDDIASSWHTSRQISSPLSSIPTR